MKIGILGGGQLARMLVESSLKYDFDFKIFSGEKDSPAGKIVKEEFVGDWNDDKDLFDFSKDCDVITLENEFIDSKRLEFIESLGKKVYPSPANIKIIQDKLSQKSFLKEHEIPAADFCGVETTEDIKNFVNEHGYPVVLKTRTMGYDGYGNYLIKSAGDISAGYKKLQSRGKLMCEKFIDFEKELAIQAVRSRFGEIKLYNIVETIQENHVCSRVLARRDMDLKLYKSVKAVTHKILKTLHYTGILAVEFFMTKEKRILVNELAPRVHNSGHYTIDACITSQFENHIRAVAGMHPGNTNMLPDYAVMINILGRKKMPFAVENLEEISNYSNVSLHLYGKKEVREGRKMGHITVIGNEEVFKPILVVPEPLLNVRSRGIEKKVLKNPESNIPEKILQRALEVRELIIT